MQSGTFLFMNVPFVREITRMTLFALDRGTKVSLRLQLYRLHVSFFSSRDITRGKQTCNERQWQRPLQRVINKGQEGAHILPHIFLSKYVIEVLFRL